MAGTRRTPHDDAPRVTDEHLEQELAHSRWLYRLLAENTLEVVSLVDLAGNFAWSSPSIRTEWGIEASDVIGQPSTLDVHPDDLALVQSVIARANSGERNLYHEVRWRGQAAGEYRWMGVTAGAAIDDDGTIVGHIVSARDIHEQVLARQALADSEQRYRLLAENASDVVWRVSEDGQLDWVSESVDAVLGWQADQLIGRRVPELIHPSDVGRLAIRPGAAGGSSQAECRVMRPDGSHLWMSLTVRNVQAGDGPFQVVALRNVQREFDTMAQLTHAKEHDQLTGLATLPVATARIDRLIERVAVHGRPGTLGVLCVGVDSLKSVNEALSYAAGDQILLTIAERIGAVQDDFELIARGSGGDFILVLPNLDVGGDAGTVAEHVRIRCKGAIDVGGHIVEPTVSIGIATGGRDAQADELLRSASLAMRQAKANGRDRCEYAEPHLAEEARVRLMLEREIRDGLRDAEFEPWFQPVVTLADGRTVGYEALVRWIRPDGSVSTPDEFLALAEHASLVIPLDFAVLEYCAGRMTELSPALSVAVNVSANTLRSPDYPEQVLERLARAGVDPSRLCLEITETALLSETASVRDTMARLAGRGIRWYIDDFGTGYSSIAHLRDLPVAGIKLDRSFTAGLGAEDPTCERLARALAGLADGLGLDTVAEGIETAEEARTLIQQGWRHGQGWLYGRAEPLPTQPS